MKRALVGIAAALLLSACEDGLVSEDRGVTANQIELVSTPRNEAEPIDLVERLQPITRSDIEREGLLGAGCDFSANGSLLLVAAGDGALVRFGRDLVHLVGAGPVGPTGGFFEDRQVSVSVGLLGDNRSVVNEPRSGPARAIVTNRRTEVENEIEGVWTCGA